MGFPDAVRLWLEPEVWPLVAAVFGLAVGSFANVLIHRLPRQLPVAFPPSRCPACGARILACDNVPVLSWLWLRGRCRACRAPISPRYPAVEMANALLWAGAAVHFGPTARGLFAFVLLTALLALALIDAELQLLPDRLTLPVTALALLATAIPGWPISPTEAALTAAGGWLAMAAVARAAERYYGEEALGQGDWKLTAMLGAALGWQSTLFAVFAGSLAGALVGGALLLSGRGGRRMKLPFGTFLCAGGVVALFYGEPIMAWYRGLLDPGGL